MTTPLYIVDGIRTPFCKVGTDLADESATDLGAKAVNYLLAKTGIDPARFDQVVVGCVGQPADSANIARVIALRSGIPTHVPAVTVQRNCASGLEALTQAQQHAAAGRGDVFLVGATESMSQYPLLFPQPTARKLNRLARTRSKIGRWMALAGFRPKDFRPRAALKLGLTDPTCGLNMGQTAENLAREFGISRRQQDLYALHSHRRATRAKKRFRKEIFPLNVGAVGRKSTLVENDNGPREKQSEESLAKLKPIFERKFGTVTAGNASGINDGAATVLLANDAALAGHDLESRARIIGTTVLGCDPARFGLGPVGAVQSLCEQASWDLAGVDAVEINEAFAVQTLACARDLGLSDAQLNPRGGAIALGHPIGASGARILVTLLHHLEDNNVKRGIATLCVGGGMGIAMAIERG